MKRAIACLLVLAAVAAFPGSSFGEIVEVADQDGNVTHYKYTDRNGTLAFSDSLAAIPDEIRRKNKIVRVGPPAKRKVPAARKPDEAAAPPAPVPDATALPVIPVPVPVPLPPADDSGGGSWITGLLAVLGLAVVGVLIKVFGPGKKAPKRGNGAAVSGRERPHDEHEAHPGHPRPHEPSPPRRPERTPEAPPPAAEPPRRPETPQEALERMIGAREYLGAAQLCESQGEPARAGELYVKAGLYPDAAAAFEQAGDCFRAGEAHLKAGNPQRAADCFERGGDPVRGYTALSSFCYDQGDTPGAAAWAEKAGDLMQAAAMCQEVGDFPRAADLFFRAGCFEEAGELFSQLGDPARTAECFERSGKFLQAAQALEQSGGDKEKIAALLEQGGDCYAAGRAWVKLGQLDRALDALQRIDPEAPEYGSGSLLVGMIFLKRGQTDLAREKLTKLIAGRPIAKGTLEPYYFLALCSERSGDPAGAKAIFAKILAEDYHFRDVRARLERAGA